MDASESIPVVLVSVDDRAVGNGSSWLSNFSGTILSGEAEAWEVTLLDIELSGVPNTDVLVYSSVVQPIIIGSQRRQLLRAVAQTDFNGLRYFRSDLPLEWRAVGVTPPISSIEITLADQNGQAIPSTSTRITLLFKRRGLS